MCMYMVGCIYVYASITIYNHTFLLEIVATRVGSVSLVVVIDRVVRRGVGVNGGGCRPCTRGVGGDMYRKRLVG